MPLKWTVPFFERIFSLILGLVFLQIPQFISQYIQHLKGHIQELNLIILKLTDIAKINGKTFQEYILKFTKSEDPDFLAQGRFMESLIDRFSLLNDSLESLQASSYFSKPFIFIKNMDYSIVKETKDAFDFGLKFDLESLIYFLAGLFIGFAFYRIVLKIFNRKKLNARQSS